VLATVQLAEESCYWSRKTLTRAVTGPGPMWGGHPSTYFGGSILICLSGSAPAARSVAPAGNFDMLNR